jgi:TetR/AcrR family transcriptional regulator
MAYEVTKLVNGRPYRYRVRSERDPASGKTRNRWTYLGRGDAGGPPAAAKPRANAREALLDALERLLDRSDPGDVTAAAVSVEAGLAHGTFYRYFRNRVAAIRALGDRLRSARAAELGLIDEPPTSVHAARAALRAWTGVLLRARTEHPGLVRALFALAARDPEIRAALVERRDGYARRLAAWLRELADRGIVALPAPEVVSAVLFSMLDGIGREAVTAGEPLEEAHVIVAIDLVERAVFGVVPA